MGPTARMNMIKRLVSILPLFLILQGCAILEPVGSFFSQGYRNTVAYFNAYYNASRLFSDAEDEYLKGFRTYQQAVRDGATTPFRVPQTAAQKFNAVIDKCSNILTFQAESDYVQDALFLIARSYDYLGETVKAERKYSELIAQYPLSGYRIEAVARLGGVLMLQDRRDEARILLEQAEQEALESDDEDMIPFILERLAVLHRDAGEYDAAYAYYARLMELSDDHEGIVSALIDYAHLQLELDKPEEALQIARNVGELTDDEFYLFDGRMLEVDALKAMDRLDDALTRIDETLGDFRFLTQQAPFRLLRADILLEAGREREALDEYTDIDTTFIRRGPGASAAYALGTYYTSHGDYAAAKTAFERAAGVAGASVSADARRKAVSLVRYIGLLDTYGRIDSVLTALRDSITTLPDPRLDSMETLLGSVMQDMGDWHFADMNEPDSAYHWLIRSVRTGKNRPGQARALFILADISAQDTVVKYDSPSTFYQRIVDEFPDSPYSSEARQRLGLAEETTTDPGLSFYRRAEIALEMGRANEAALIFDSLGVVHPSSQFAVQGSFAAAWVYENMLAEADSASVRYEQVVRSGGKSRYVQEAKTRLAAIARSRPDSVAAQASPAPSDSTGAATPPTDGRQGELIEPQEKPAVQDRRLNDQ